MVSINIRRSRGMCFKQKNKILSNHIGDSCCWWVLWIQPVVLVKAGLKKLRGLEGENIKFKCKKMTDEEYST